MEDYANSYPLQINQLVPTDAGMGHNIFCFIRLIIFAINRMGYP